MLCMSCVLSFCISCPDRIFIGSFVFNFEVQPTYNFEGQHFIVALQAFLCALAIVLTGPRLWIPSHRPIGPCTIVLFRCMLRSVLLHPYRLKLIMDNSFRLELQNARASIERHGPRPVFQLPWERGIWRRLFNPHPSPLSLISRSLPLPSSYSGLSHSNASFNSHSNSSFNFNSNFAPNSLFSFASSSLPPSSIPSEQPFHSESLTAEPSTDFCSRFFGHSDLQQGRSDGLPHLAISRLISFLASSAGSAMFLSSSDPWDLHASFTASLSMKATSTIIKRSLDLLRFN